MKGLAKVVAIKAPGSGQRSIDLMEDLAILTGASIVSDQRGLVLSDVEREHLGSCSKITITKYNTIIAGGEGNKEEIKARAKHLSEMAVSVWQVPQLDVSILDAYRPRTQLKAEYSIKDHPHLLSGVSQKLFEAFRKEVLGLDPVVNEDFLKLYVAYKAETNFVDVVPQAKRLRLSLNMRFPDISDPRGKCKDVSGLGRWGNGDVEVAFSSLDELPYIMGLVRQAFERQMGNGGEL